MKNERIIWLDYIRCFACLSVIILHISATYVIHNYKSNYDSWLFGNFLDSFTRTCVPLFFMISGYLFMSEKSPSYKNFLKIVTALLFYSVLGWIANEIYYVTGIYSKKPNFDILEKPVYYHLWFFYTLIPIYIFMMIVKSRDINIRKTAIIFFILFFIFNPKTRDLTSNLFNISVVTKFTINDIFIYYLFYAFLGGSINKIEINKSKSTPILSIILFLLSSIMIAILTINVSEKAGKSNVIFYGYTTPLVAIAAVSIFIFFKSLSIKLKDIKFISLISKHSLGIYGIHAIILSIMISIFDFHKKDFLIWFPLTFSVVLTISLLFAFFLRKIDKKGYIS
ncbi:acyltransferase family protein [Proteus terrae]|uniref:acyltransferase n=1 Tax=Proteus terrae TaxID=1574161 RepID=UPI0021B3016F|nr:acyltransferase family protein [Proteus terrae]UXA35524.1 acyltransferase family protein [Proteus terrae]UXA35828.1 acyltransferase family protein [Proteus terrae]